MGSSSRVTSFRSRLTLFFAFIVIVPLLAVAVTVFRLIAQGEQGKSDASVAQGQTAAIGLYRREIERASAATARVGADRALALALRSGDRVAATARASALERAQHLSRIAIMRDGRTFVDVGSPDATATARRQLIGSAGVVGELRVSTITTHEYAALAADVTGLQVAVQRDGRMIASTLSGIDDRPLPRVGDLAVHGSRYRTASFTAAGFGNQTVRIAVLLNTDRASADVSSARTIAAAVLVAFLVMAFAFALLVSRSLQSEIGRLLTAARRLAGGDFSTPVATQGHDEFAALGGEFNDMARQLEARLEELRRERARLQESVRRIGQTAASNLDRDALLEIFVRTIVEAVRAGAGRATSRERAGTPLEQRAGTGDLRHYGELIRTVEARALESGKLAEGADEAAAALAHPLVTGAGEVVGLISVARAGEPFTPDERDLFGYLASQATVSIENVDLHELVQRQAVTDELTGLFNHRRFQEVVAAEVERARRYDQAVGLVMLDIDDFKMVNDTHGHQQGDIVLREVARVLRASSREIDEPARYGGEELAVALPQTDLEGTYQLAERVRTAVESLAIPRLDGGGILRVTASFGAAALPESADDKETLIAAADAALYRAKSAGKNRTERAGRVPTRAPAK
jgi:diguanylate cyclase (GGDEF)-like protein